MKVLLIHNFYKENSIGGEDLVFRSEKEGLKQIIGEKNVYTFTRNNEDISMFRAMFEMFFSVSAFFKVLYLIKRHEIDIIHVHNTFPSISPSVFIAARLLKKRSVLTLHNFRLHCVAGTFYRNNYGVCEDCFVKSSIWPANQHKCFRGSLAQTLGATSALFLHRKLRLYNFVDYFFVLTRFQEEKLIGMGYNRKKLLLKPNFVLTKIAESSEDIERFDFLYVGRLEESKGILDVLRNWNEIDIPYTLGVIGVSTHYVELPEHKNIKYLGKKDNAVVKNYMSRCRYVLQPSQWYETFGLTIIEAMSTGTPVIGYKLGTRPEFIQDGMNGFFLSKDHFQEGLDKAMNYENYSKLVEGARSTALLYTKRKILDEQVKLYSYILDN